MEVSKFTENSSVLADWAWSNLFSDNLDQTPIKYSKLILPLSETVWSFVDGKPFLRF